MSLRERHDPEVKNLLRDVLRAFDQPCDISWIQGEYRLTPKEMEILGLLVEGNGPRQISEVFGTKVSTVRNQIHKTYVKMRVNNMAELMSLLLNGDKSN